jgi:hypothetical protein
MKNKLFILAMGFALTTQMIIAQVPSYVPTNGLVGYWPFNGNANDESGNGNNGTVNGATLTTDRLGASNSAYSFDGQSEISCSFNGVPSGNVNRTLNLWIRNNSINQVNKMLAGYGNDSPLEMFALIMYNPSSLGKVAFWARDNDTPFLNTISLNEWTMFSVVYNNNTVFLYENGIFILENDYSFIPLITPQSSIFHIGNFNNNVTGFFGQIDDVSLWNRALTQQEITNLYNSTSTSECLTMTINTGVLSTSPVTYTSTVNIYPNPANDQITIDCGNLANVVGWNIKITNMLGQEVFNQPMNTQQYVVPLNSWTGQGMYFVKIINAQNEVVNIKKIILQ